MAFSGLLKRLVVQQLARRGYQLIPNWRLNERPTEQYLRRLFDACGIDCVFDVGANAGQYYRFIRHAVGYQGPIVSFEPLPEMLDSLRRLAANDRHLYIESCALGAEAGHASFNVMRGSQYSSFLEPQGKYVAQTVKDNTALDAVTVRVRTLTEVHEEYARRLGFRRVYLKLDTQGYDLMVLKGGEEVLPLIPALQSEMSVLPIYEGMPNYRQAIDTLEAYGYRLSAIFPNNAGLFPRLVEFDAYMIRNEEMDRLSSP